MNLTSKTAKELLQKQLQVWGLAQGNYKDLGTVKSKEVQFDGFSITVQFNPARIQSSNAKVDAKSIQERKCFLCPANLPEVQEGIRYGEDYQLLVNPFPIFPQHFTIPTFAHTDQLILDRIGDMLDLAKVLDAYSLFYNGPKCGASAPDHAHFQAGIKGFMPIEKDVKTITKEIVLEEKGMTLFALRNYLRNSFVIEATDRTKAVDTFKKIYSLLEIKEGEQEPMMNVIAWYEADKWFLVVLPREVHRPKCFFAEGEDNILISPASVDLGGVFITPQEKDFNKISAKDIQNILEEICLNHNKFNHIINQLKQA